MDRRALALGLAGITVVAGCNLFDTKNSENSAGRGPKAFDPYSGAASGALRLGLQNYNGCAILATGEPVGKGNANIPYPSDCPRDPTLPIVPPASPAPPMPLQAGARYFLNQITLEDQAEGLHTDVNNMGAVTEWMRTQSHFAALDWENLGIIRDEIALSDLARAPGVFDRTVQFGNANWQTQKGQTFTVEVLNTDGTVVQQIVYDRSDFLAENAIAGHTQLTWTNTNIGAPEFPGDTTPHPAPPNLNGPPVGPTGYVSRLRIDMILSTHPQKSFVLDAGLVGDGAIRLTWSAMPSAPFYFPVTFVKAADLPTSCFDGKDGTTPVRCDFGLQPEVTLRPPSNGKFYMPGEQLEFQLALKDGAGNYLHTPDQLPSYDQAQAGNANGILYLSAFGLLVAGEKDSINAVGVSGPKQEMRPFYEFVDPNNFYSLFDLLGLELAFSGAFPGASETPIPAKRIVNLPSTLKPGTYTIYYKAHRQFLGERFTKIHTVDFQVGQEAKTEFPGRVGNCQICHRGVISMDNVRHGLNVDYVEGCKTCHNRSDPSNATITSQALIHQVHMSSPKYPQAKNNCTFCHLTKESAVRPSYTVCQSCHPQPHGTEYWDLPLQSPYDDSQRGTFGNCAQQCHGTTLPTAHILPPQ